MLTTDHLRLATAVAWSICCAFLLPGTVRALAWRPRGSDDWKAVAFFSGVLFVAFPSRTVIAPGDELTRQGLFALCTLLAAITTALTWRGRRP